MKEEHPDSMIAELKDKRAHCNMPGVGLVNLARDKAGLVSGLVLGKAVPVVDWCMNPLASHC